MRRLCSALLITFMMPYDASLPAFAGINSQADYPLRVHVYETKWHFHPDGRADGVGRANLFEHGEPRAFDYTFNCSQLFRHSMGYETYPAKWRKRNGELEILGPVPGQPSQFRECILEVVMKDAAYYTTPGGKLHEEPASVFKTWMEKHNYDPEHGKNMPSGMNRERKP